MLGGVVMLYVANMLIANLHTSSITSILLYVIDTVLSLIYLTTFKLQTVNGDIYRRQLTDSGGSFQTVEYFDFSHAKMSV